MSRLHPGWVVVVLVVLIVSQVLYIAYPYQRRWYLATLLATALGVAMGQAWDALNLPSARFGEANILPALIFAVALQPLVSRLPRRPEK